MYYVYMLLDPRKNNSPFYVGKGTGERWKDHLRETAETTVNISKFNTIQKIIGLGFEVGHVIVKTFDDEDQAYLFEEQLIIRYGRKGYDPNGILTNICVGGTRPPHWQNGPNRAKIIEKLKETKISSKFSHTQETKDEISRKLSGKKKPRRTSEHCAALSSALKGKPLKKLCSQETRSKRRLNQLGKTVPTETRNAISKSLTGRKLSEEHKEKIRAARLKK